MEKKNIVITGMSGLLGSALRQILEKTCHVYDIGVDIADAKAIEKFDIVGKKIDWIIHTAAMTDVNYCEKEQQLCQNVNVDGTRHVRDLAKTHNSNLLYISTASVFSGEEGNYKEDDVPSPTNFYNRTKYEGEQAVLEYDKGTILRINLIGVHPSGSRGQNFFEWLIDCVRANKSIKLFSDVMVNPLSNWTIAEFVKEIIEKDSGERILHIASKNVWSKADIGKYVMEKLGYRGKAEFTSVDSLGGAKRPKQMWLNTDKTCQKMHWQMPTLESEIEKILMHTSYGDKN